MSDSNTTFRLEVPLSELSKADRERYIEQRVRYMVGRAQFEAQAYSVDKEAGKIEALRNLWNGSKQEELYRYLSNTTKKQIKNSAGEKELIELGLPAKVRHTPILKERLKTIVTQRAMRPLVPQVVATDTEALERKNKELQDTVHKTLLEEIEGMNKASQAIDQLIALRKQMIEMANKQQQQSQDTSSSNVVIQQLTKSIQDLEKMKMQYERYDAKKMETIYREKQMNYRDQQEVMTTNALHEFITTFDLKELFVNGIEEQLIHDREVYFCGFEKKDIELRLIKPEYLWYELPNEKCTYVSEANWIAEYMPMSIELIRHHLGIYLTDDMLEILNTRSGYLTNRGYSSSFKHSHSPYDITPDGQFVSFTNTNTLNRARINNENSDTHNAVEVVRFFWKEPTAVYWLCKIGDKLLDEDDPDYDDIWETILTTTEVEEWLKKPKSKKKGYKIEKSYRNELWQAYIIDREFIVNVQKIKHAVRYPNEFGDVEMPYIGYATTKYNQSVSLLQKCKPLQELYDIVTYKEELTIALSGVKGVIIDRALIPQGMSPAEFILNRKQGVIHIDRYKNGHRLEGATDNQLSTFDDTLPAGTTVFGQIKMDIINTISILTGINEQMAGQVNPNAGLGVTQLALDQSNIMVEYYIQRHENLVKKVLQRLANLFPAAYKKGKQGSFIFGHNQKMLNIAPNSLQGNFVVSIKNGKEEINIINAIRTVAETQVANGLIDFTTYISVLDNTNIQELKYIIAQSQDSIKEAAQQQESKMQEQAQQSQQAMMEQQQAMQEKITKLQGDQVKELEVIKGQLGIQKEQIKIAAAAERSAIQANLQKEVSTKQSDSLKYQTDIKAKTDAVALEIEQRKVELDNALQQATLLNKSITDYLSITNKTKSTTK